LREPLGNFVGCDPEIVEELDLILRFLQKGLAGLSPLLEGLGLLLKDAGEPR
jgi:hypothetical protein